MRSLPRSARACEEREKTGVFGTGSIVARNGTKFFRPLRLQLLLASLSNFTLAAAAVNSNRSSPYARSLARSLDVCVTQPRTHAYYALGVAIGQTPLRILSKMFLWVNRMERKRNRTPQKFSSVSLWRIRTDREGRK